MGLLYRTGRLSRALGNSPELGATGDRTETVDARFISARAAQHLMAPYCGFVVSCSHFNLLVFARPCPVSQLFNGTSLLL